MAKGTVSPKKPQQKSNGTNRLFAISNPTSGGNANVSAGMGPGGMLCLASGQAIAPDPGFELYEVRAYNVAGNTPPSDSDVNQFGRSLTFDANRNWTANSQLAAYLMPSTTNTLKVVYNYKKPGVMPPQTQQKSETVTYTAVRVNSCPSFAPSPPVRPLHLANSCDKLPTSKIGKTYVYKKVPTTCAGLGVRLMHDRDTPLHASEIQIAAVKVRWTPQKDLELNLHRPVGEFEVGAEAADPVPFRFPAKQRHSIVLFQPSARVAHTLLSQTSKVPDGFSLHSFLDIHVMVNELDFEDYYADNDGTFDLWVRVVKP